MRFSRFAVIAMGLLVACERRGGAAPPEQFRAWGTAGTQYPSVPEGWTEVRDAPEGLPPLTPTLAEERQGYVLFARDPFALVGPDTIPAPSERASELRAFAALGEYEPLSFAIHALVELSEVQVEVRDLHSEEGGIIATDHMDVRVARCVRVAVDGQAKTYRLQPFLLEKRETFSVAKGKSTQVWLTLKSPDTTKAGEYKGTVAVKVAGRGAAQLKLLLRVLPFALPPTPSEMAVFFPRPSESDGMLMKELVDLRYHGMNAIEPGLDVQIKTRDRKFGEDDIAATRAQGKRLLDAVKKVYGSWRFPVTFEVGHQIAFYWDQGKNWFTFWPHSEAIESDFLKAIQVVTDLAKAEGWPSLRAYALDEAGAHNLLDEAVYYYRLIKERTSLATYTTIGGGMAMGYDEIGQLSPVVDFLSTNRFTPEIAKSLVARGKPYGIYNGAGSTPAGARFFFGFYGWKTGAQQIAQWVYAFGEAVFKGNGFRQDDEGYVYHAPDGPLPSPMWEAVRGGVDDYRYTELLWQLIATAEKSGQPEAQKVAREARKALVEMLSGVPWTFQALKGEDRTPPPHPSTLRKWRWKVAQQILKLQAYIKGAPSVVSRPSPFDFPWVEPEKEEVRFGAELLPPSDFEVAMKPWRIEAWNKKGVGELDAGEHHSGKQSVRIEIPADAANEAVTVLVWPQWGGGNLNLSLDGDRIYEFSAWVKFGGRGTPPDLRLNLPGGATARTWTGQDNPTAHGWQRVWVRTEVHFRVQPTYLAAWVQGPGTVWVDDLSLREVVPPLLDVQLDQDEYDSGDKVGVATVTVAKRAVPARVRFTLLPVGGKAIAELTAPFRAVAVVSSASLAEGGALSLVAPADLRVCRFVFDPSAWPPGKHEMKTELLDQQGTVLAARTVVLEKV